MDEEICLNIEKHNKKNVEQANKLRKLVEFDTRDLVRVHLRKKRFPPRKFEKVKPTFKVIEKIEDNVCKFGVVNQLGHIAHIFLINHITHIQRQGFEVMPWRRFKGKVFFQN